MCATCSLSLSNMWLQIIFQILQLRKSIAWTQDGSTWTTTVKMALLQRIHYPESVQMYSDFVVLLEHFTALILYLRTSRDHFYTFTSFIHKYEFLNV